MPPNQPYILAGKVYQSDGTTFSNGTTVQAIQESTGEILVNVTNSQGEYAFDCANFTSYSDGQFIKILATGSTSSTQDLRMKIVSRSTLQVSEIKVEYTAS